VGNRKPRNLQNLRNKIEIASVAIPPANLREVCLVVARFYQKCSAAGGRYFEYL
jgi:hypothetical protein